MWNHTLFGTDLYHIIHWFFVYSIIGWLLESVYMSICNKKFTNRGFIKGPICPIYGIGALAVYFVLRPLEGNYVALFICGSMLATLIEYITAQIMLSVFGEVWWDYSEKPFNHRGILCLESSIAWGFYTVFLFLFLQNSVVRIVDSYPMSVGRVLGPVVLTYFILDFGISLYKAKADRLPKSVMELKDSIRSLYRNF